MKRLKVAGVLVAKCLLSALLVSLVLRRVDAADVVSRVTGVGWFFPGAAFLCFVVLLFLAACRWQLLSGGLLSYGLALKYTWIGLFYSAILPGIVSGDVVKGASLALRNRDARVAELPLSIVMDRIIGLYVLLGFFVVSCALLVFTGGPINRDLRQLSGYGLAGGSAVLLGVAFLAVFVRKALGKRDTKKRSPTGALSWLGKAFDTLQLYRHRPHLLFKAAGYSVVIHAMGIMSYYLVIRGLGLDCHLMEVVAFYSMLSVLVSLPVTISGLGLRDWFSLTFFQSLWGDGHAGVAFAWLALTITLVASMAGGIVQIADLFNSRTAGRDSEGRAAVNF